MSALISILFVLVTIGHASARNAQPFEMGGEVMNGERMSDEGTSDEVVYRELMSGKLMSGKVMSSEVMSDEGMSGEGMSGEVEEGDLTVPGDLPDLELDEEDAEGAGGVFEYGRSLMASFKSAVSSLFKRVRRKGPKKYFSKCPHKKTPEVMKNISDQLIADLARKGYTTAAAAFNVTGVLMGIRHKATILVPANEAFDTVPEEVVKLLANNGYAALKRIMMEHMLKASLRVEGKQGQRFFRTYLGTKVKATATRGRSGASSFSFTTVHGYRKTRANVVAPALIWNCFGQHQGVDQLLIPSLDLLTPSPSAEAPAPSPVGSASEPRIWEAGPSRNSFQWQSYSHVLDNLA